MIGDDIKDDVIGAQECEFQVLILERALEFVDFHYNFSDAIEVPFIPKHKRLKYWSLNPRY